VPHIPFQSIYNNAYSQQIQRYNLLSAILSIYEHRDKNTYFTRRSNKSTSYTASNTSNVFAVERRFIFLSFMDTNTSNVFAVERRFVFLCFRDFERSL
jgi:hypothetical protein